MVVGISNTHSYFPSHRHFRCVPVRPIGISGESAVASAIAEAATVAVAACPVYVVPSISVKFALQSTDMYRIADHSDSTKDATKPALI